MISQIDIAPLYRVFASRSAGAADSMDRQRRAAAAGDGKTITFPGSSKRPPPKAGFGDRKSGWRPWDYPVVQDTCPSKAKDDHIYLRLLHDACKRLGGG